MSVERHQRVKQIFLAACRQDPAARGRFVRQSCGDDAELRHDVEVLLSHHNETTIMPVSSSDADSARRAASKSRPSRSRFSSGVFRRAMHDWMSGLSLAGQLALGAALMLVLVFGMAWWSHDRVRTSLRRAWMEGLTMRSTAIDQLLESWFSARRTEVGAVTAKSDVLRAAQTALGPAGFDPEGESPSRQLTPAARELAGPNGFFVVYDLKMNVKTFGGLPELQTPPGSGAALRREFERVRQGQTVPLLPHQCAAIEGGEWFGIGKPLVGFLQPIRDVRQTVIGAWLVAGSDYTDSLNAILAKFRSHSSGEAYLVDRDGRLLTESRFRDRLVAAGLLPADRESTILFPLRDPGGNLARGHRLERPYPAYHRTEAVARVTAEVDGFNLDGYRDYLGVPVIGIWKWNRSGEYGLIFELDSADAFEALDWLDLFYRARLVLVGGALGLVVWSWYSTSRMRGRLRDVLRIGPYALEGLIGEGGMGRVYRSRHILLKRSTAVKVIKPELVNERSIEWFEREVAIAGRLKHPNTVEIYDFGRTSEGQFYCAMEFLNGLTLAQIVLIEGSLPARRVIYILLHAAYSLREAHHRGMVHRDVKPHNIMLCVLGGEPDVVKVLDFGLAKQSDASDATTATDTKLLAGTPMYLAPERLQPPFTADARSDVYALGMTAYKLLTGRDLFSGGSDLEVFHQTLHMPPADPAALASRPVPAELSELVVACLAKDPAKRPQTMQAIVDVLEPLAEIHAWRHEESRRWWQENASRVRQLFPMWDADEELNWDEATGT